MPNSGGSNDRGLDATNEERSRGLGRDEGQGAQRGQGEDRAAAISDSREAEQHIPGGIADRAQRGGTNSEQQRGDGSAQAGTETTGRGKAKKSGTSNRGFASMDPERQREIASKGGRAAHRKGTAHEWTSEEARVAGRKGGEAVSRDRAHMAQIGREGGEARGNRANRNRNEGGEQSRDQESRT